VAAAQVGPLPIARPEQRVALQPLHLAPRRPRLEHAHLARPVSNDNPVLRKLQRLYQLAILREDEEGNEGRQNEARTAAFLLLKTARENGVKVRFEVPKKDAPPPRYTVADPPPGPGWEPFQVKVPVGGYYGNPDVSGLEDFLRDALRKNGNGAARVEVDGAFTRNTTAAKRRAPSSSGKPPLIRSKFAAVCQVCKEEPLIEVGERVWWVPGAGVAHEACGFEGLLEKLPPDRV
jgi:hypothetical protein